MRRAGMDVVRQHAAPGRPHVVGVLDGATPGPSLMLCGHIDTVGVEGMADPFTPRVADGRLYARGAQDMKGGVAAMIAAAAVLAPNWHRGRLLVAAVIDEEYESIGAEALVREWRADAAIVTEPTDLRVAIGHKGFAWLEIVTEGRAAHGSRPKDGRDAIARMGRVLVALEARDRELQARPPMPFQGTASLHASLIQGGRELSSYPDRCTLQMERRTVSGETERTVTEEVDAILSTLAHADAEFRAHATLKTMRPAYCLDPSHAFTRMVCAAAAAQAQAADPIGMSFWTDAAILGAAGIPSLLFGPGGAGLHGIEEYVNVDDLAVCRDVICDVARRWCDGH
jgi:acetylornithine deacetylase